MKKILIMLFLGNFLTCTCVNAQWTGSTIATTTLGNIGAGTNSPAAKVHIVAGNSVGSSWVSGLQINNYSGTTNNGNILSVYNSPNIIPPIVTLLFGVDRYKTYISNALTIGTNAPTGYDLSVDGNAYIAQSMRIGTSAASGPYANYKLSVDGDMIAKRCVVEIDYWADYVFNENYALPELSTVEQYINENNHLPGVPSEREVKEKGLDVGEMNKILMQKVEKLTLYMIQLKKENEEIKKELGLDNNK